MIAMQRLHILFAIPLGIVPWTAAVLADESVVGSVHDLSVFGPGSVHALEEAEVCIFCHAPHRSSGQTPLWNRLNPTTHYRIYQSSTTDARIDQPSGPSKMCLSCHDGAISIGLIASRPATDPIAMNLPTVPPGPSDLTTDLADDHPIGFRYDRALANRDRQLKDPGLVTRDLPLGSHGELHCTTCHDAHNNELGDFLRLPAVRSAICLSCHEMFGWNRCAHAVSMVPVIDREVDPRMRSRFGTVAENGCSSCHKIHSAASPERLLRFRREEENCLNCHSGGVARTNLESEFRKRSAHPIRLSTGRHDPVEDPRTMPRHVECADCHNPHAVAADTSARIRGFRQTYSTLPVTVSPANRFVSGTDSGGRNVSQARFEYEICLKCHAETLTAFRRPEIVRQIQQTNTRLEFQTGNPSFHPVFGPRRNSEVVSLTSPLRVGDVIACTDCHNSDSAAKNFWDGASGPHGSVYEPLLVENYSTGEFVIESPQAYALCYRCHQRESILGDESFPLHNVHILRGRSSCASCHDAHGISRTQGNAAAHGHLINFDLTVVRPTAGVSASRVEFVDLGVQRGSCTLTCHGVTHVNFTYGR